MNLPERLEFVGSRCFCGCAFDTVTLPDSLEELQDFAFYGGQLRAVAVSAGSSLRTVGSHAFGRNGQLKREEVHFPKEAQVLENAFESI